MNKTNYDDGVDYLNEDKKIDGQNWVCISFLSPESISNCTTRGLKIRGVFNTYEEAKKYAKYLQSVDPDFHVFVGEVGKWLPWDPNANDVNDQVYADKRLNALMKKYKEGLLKAEAAEAQRKNDMIKNAIRAEQNASKPNNNKLNKERDRLRRKLDQKRKNKNSQNVNNLDCINKENSNEEYVNKEHIDKEDIKKEQKIIKEKKKIIDETQKEINKHENEVSLIDEKIIKIQQLYNNMKNKQNN